jgi:predicted dehydrogenase
VRAFSIGVVGAGQIVRDVHLPVLCALPAVRVAWISDAQVARAQALGRDYGVPSVAAPENPADLPPCDVALLGIPTHARGPYYEALAARGTAVLAEKPFAIGARDHERFAALFPAHRVGCGYMRRFYRSTAILRRTVEARPFGALVALRAAEGGRATKTGFDSSFLDRPSRDGGGVLWGIGCHLLDLLAHLTSASEFEILGHDVVFDADTDREASAEIRFTGRSSVVARFCTSWLGPQTNRVELAFENATVSAAIQPGGAVTVELLDGGRLALDLGTNEPWALTPYQAFHLEWRAFLDGIAAERPSLVAASSSLVTTRLIDRLLAAGSRP